MAIMLTENQSLSVHAEVSVARARIPANSPTIFPKQSTHRIHRRTQPITLCTRYPGHSSHTKAATNIGDLSEAGSSHHRQAKNHWYLPATFSGLGVTLSLSPFFTVMRPDFGSILNINTSPSRPGSGDGRGKPLRSPSRLALIKSGEQRVSGGSRPDQ